MYISDGILSPLILILGNTLAVGGIMYGLKRLSSSDIPKIAVLGAVFFMSTLIFIPLPLVKVRFLLLGLMGIVLGWSSFVVFVFILFLQTVFLGYGGITTLGVNTLILAVPAVISRQIFQWMVGCLPRRRFTFLLGTCIGAFALLLSTALTFGVLVGSRLDYLEAALLLVYFYIPIICIESCVVGAVVTFLFSRYEEFERLIPQDKSTHHTSSFTSHKVRDVS